MQGTELRRSLVKVSPAWILAVAVGAGVFLWCYARLWGFLLDDVFISVRYAQNLARGLGLAYNPGERVEGYTNFLYTVMLAAAFPLNLGILPFVKILNAAFALAAACGVWRLGRALPLDEDPRQNRALALVPVLLFLLTPAVVISAAEGLETMLFTALLVWSTAIFLQEGGRGGFPWSAVLLALVAMTRPDGVAFGPWFLIAGVLLGRTRQETIRFAAVFLGLFAAYFVCRMAYYGDPLPNTFYAKGGGSLVLLRRGLGQFGRFVADCGGWVWIAALGAFTARRRRGAALFLGGIVVLRAAFHLWSGGPWMGHHRFLVPALPFLHVLTVAGLSAWRAGTRGILVPTAAALMLLPGWMHYPIEEARVLGYAASLRRAHVAFGSAVNARTSPDAVIAMDDAGIGPLLSDRTTIDMLGLNDRRIAHLPGAYGKTDVRYVLSRRPDLIVLLAYNERPEAAEEFRIPGHATLFRDGEFRAMYRLARRFAFAPDYHLLVYRRTDSRAVPPDF